MFPEYRDLISRLKNENPRFMSLFDKHNKLDHEIARKEGSDGRGYNAEVVRMKKQKLQLKDEMLKICNFAFFSGLIGAQFWAERAQPKSPELDAKLLVSY